MAATRSVLSAQTTGGTVRSLIIVARDQSELWQALTREFGQSQDIRVILDRRCGERRRTERLHTPDRRGMDRRSMPRIEDDLRARQYVLARPHYRLPKD
jgi:hypothetical protein